MQDSPAHSVVVVKTGLLSGHPASPKRWGVCTGNHGPDAGWDRIDGWWNLGGSTERFEHEPWSQEKDFGLKETLPGKCPEVCLDGADVVIDGMLWSAAVPTNVPGLTQETTPYARWTSDNFCAGSK